MGPGQVSIPAHSRRQVMDWGLVLASQGIEATVLDLSECGNLPIHRKHYVYNLNVNRWLRAGGWRRNFTT